MKFERVWIHENCRKLMKQSYAKDKQTMMITEYQVFVVLELTNCTKQTK